MIHKINNKITLCKHTIVNKKNISTKKSEPEGVITNKQNRKVNQRRRATKPVFTSEPYEI